MERLNPLPDPTGGLFVNRDYELSLFWKWGTGIPNLVQTSYALVGLRRTGKTAILHKLFNRLFYEQRHEQQAVMPVYISFSDYLHRPSPITVYEFAEEFFVGYMRSYLAFRYREPEFIRWQFDLIRLKKFARQVSDEFMIEWSEHYEEAVLKSTPYGLARWLINFPRGAARIKNIPTAMIIDEFQVLTEVLNPKSGQCYDLTNGFQKAAESRWAGLLVSGSSISILVGRALGGMLSGRFQTHHLKPLSREHTHDLVYKLAARLGLKATEELAEAIWLLTWGYPYSIRSLMSSKCLARQKFPDLSALGDVFLFELTSEDGQLWSHYNEEFGKVVQQLNDSPTTQHIMLWATKYPDQQIDVKRVAQELNIEEKAVRASLEKLRWVDVVKKSGLISYSGPNDPMMRRFIGYQYDTEIKNLSPTEAVDKWKLKYESLRGTLSRQKGFYAEVHVGAVMRCFDERAVDGELYFNCPQKVSLPKFERIEQRGGVVDKGIMVEMDLIGEWSRPLPVSKQLSAGEEEEVISEGLEQETKERLAWLVQVRYTKSAMGPTEIKKFLEQVKVMKAKMGYTKVVSWYVCKGGFTQEAQLLLKKEGVLFSHRKEFNKLANLFDFFGFPA